jgi:hypothetical protein
MQRQEHLPGAIARDLAKTDGLGTSGILETEVNHKYHDIS